MPGVTFTNNGKQWVLNPDGSVSSLTGTTETPNQGKWLSDLAANNVALTIGTQPSVPIPIKYSFNKDNQLVAVVPGGGAGGTGDSAPYTFQGRIDISDNTEVRYTVLDANDQAVTDASGNAVVFFVHGTLSIDDTLNHLVITFPDKSTTFITATETDGTSVLPDHNPVTGNAGADRLSFLATTTNSYGTGDSHIVAANIVFLGSWNLNSDGLYFQAQGTGTKQMSIQLGGVYKGVAAGISVQQVGNDTDVAFFIQGTHQFKSPSGSATDVNWSVGLGYSNKQLDAVVKLDASSAPVNTGDGSFKLNGTMEFKSGPANAFALDLDATYDARSDGQLVFTGKVSKDRSGLSYNLGLEGNYTVKGGHVTFNVSVSGGATGSTATVDLGYESANGALSAHMKAVLKNDQVSYDFTLTMHFVNGILVPVGPPVPLPGAAPAPAAPALAAAPLVGAGAAPAGGAPPQPVGNPTLWTTSSGFAQDKSHPGKGWAHTTGITGTSQAYSDGSKIMTGKETLTAQRGSVQYDAMVATQTRTISAGGVQTIVQTGYCHGSRVVPQAIFKVNAQPFTEGPAAIRVYSTRFGKSDDEDEGTASELFGIVQTSSEVCGCSVKASRLSQWFGPNYASNPDRLTTLVEIYFPKTKRYANVPLVDVGPGEAQKAEIDLTWAVDQFLGTDGGDYVYFRRAT